MNKEYVRPNVEMEMAQGYYGAIQHADKNDISGWVLPWDMADTPLTLTVLANDAVIGTVYTGLESADVSKLIRRPVACGFAFSFYSSDVGGLNADDDDELKIEVEIEKTGYFMQVSGLKMTAGELKGLAKKNTVPAPSCISGDKAKYLADFPGQQVEGVKENTDVRLIAFYLPQFHPIPENDLWWGRGFTEWTNVTRARPLFEGHYQPHLPSDLGYYDLRIPEVRQAQADMARRYGIHGFCYYYYWFSGRRILERPLQEVLDSGEPDFPFCICWANETWSRRWDGSENEILIKQEHTFENDVKFIKDIIPFFKDRRYIRINGAPVLLVYRVSLFPDPVRTADLWRKICKQLGIEHIHLCAVESFGITEPRNYGFDSSVAFPPHGAVSSEITLRVPDLPADYSGQIYDYEQVVQHGLNQPPPPYRKYPSVMVSWDNTARRGKAGNVFINSSPSLYEIWLRGAIDRARATLPSGERFVFINAWNEWAEGTHLEPDQAYGTQYLEATRRAILGTSNWRLLLEYGESVPKLEGAVKDGLLSNLRVILGKYEQTLKYISRMTAPSSLPLGISRFSKIHPVVLNNVAEVISGKGNIDRINQFHSLDAAIVDRHQTLYLQGWAYCEDLVLTSYTLSFLMLSSASGPIKYYAPLLSRVERKDVMQAMTDLTPKSVQYSGFSFIGHIEDVDPGQYELSIIQLPKNKAAFYQFKGVFTIV
jgi:hypothetical protein